MSSGLRALAIHLTKVSLGKAFVEDVSNVEACRYMMYLDVSFLQVVLQPFDLKIYMLGS